MLRHSVTQAALVWAVIGSFGSGKSQAQDLEPNFKLEIPTEYYQIPKADLDQTFGTNEAEKTQCQKAYSNGRQLGFNFAKTLKPSCDELIFPLGEGEANEWSVPDINVTRGENLINFCSRLGYTAGFETTILNTSLECSLQYEAAIKAALQKEYNRCYKSVAKEAILRGESFSQNDNLLSKEAILIPKDSEAWTSFVKSLTSDVNSPLLQNACRIAISHAERRQDPVDFYTGNRYKPNGETPSPRPPEGSPVQQISYMFKVDRSGKCLNLKVTQLYTNGYSDRDNVHQWDCPQQNNEWTNNYWTVKSTSDGYYTLRSDYSSKCLVADPYRNPSDRENLALQFDCSAAERNGKFSFQKINGDKYALREVNTGLCLTLTTQQGGYNNGEFFAFTSCDQSYSSDSQRFRISPSSRQPQVDTALTSGSYMIKSMLSNRCVNLKVTKLGTDGLSERDPIHQWDCPPQNNEWSNNYWKFVSSSAGTFTLVSEYSDKCLVNDPNRGQGSSQSFAIQVHCSQSDSHGKFEFLKTPDGSYAIQERNSGQCLTLYSKGIGKNGDRFIFTKCDQSRIIQAQLFRLAPAR